MKVLERVRATGDDGLATAEYATCTVAGAGLAVLVYRFLTSDRVRDLLFQVVGSLLHWPG